MADPSQGRSHSRGGCSPGAWSCRVQEPPGWTERTSDGFFSCLCGVFTDSKEKSRVPGMVAWRTQFLVRVMGRARRADREPLHLETAAFACCWNSAGFLSSDVHRGVGVFTLTTHSGPGSNAHRLSLRVCGQDSGRRLPGFSARTDQTASTAAGLVSPSGIGGRLPSSFNPLATSGPCADRTGALRSEGPPLPASCGPAGERVLGTTESAFLGFAA